MEWSWWVTSDNACELREQLIVLANGDDESDLVRWSLLLLATTVWSFAHLPLGLPNRNKMVLWPGCESRVRCTLHKKNVWSIRFVVKRRGCCCSLSVECAIHHKQDVCGEQHLYIYMVRTSNKRVIPMEWTWWVTSNNACEPSKQLVVLANGDDESDLYCCLLPQCEALRTCRSGFTIATLVYEFDFHNLNKKWF